jgi:hypothetical protein
MRSLGRFSLFFRAAFERVADVDLLYDEDFVLDVDLAFGL